VALVLDTGPLYATLDSGERAHQACVRLIEDADERRLIPAPVLVEVDFLCERAGRPDLFRLLLEDIRRRAYSVEELRGDDYSRVSEILRDYADLHVGFVDAAILAVVERLGERKLATLDHKHFGAMRPRHVEALELLPG
jgi:predicted nucleic acid-binding protein